MVLNEIHIKIIIFSIYAITCISPLIAQSLEFEDHFDDNSNGWTVFNNPRGESQIIDGQLSIANHSKNRLMNLIQHYIDPERDFSITASMIHLGGDGNFGLTWGALGNISFFSFAIFPDSTFSVVVNKNGNYFDLFKRQKLPSGAYSANSPVLLKVAKKDYEISFEVNGYLLGNSEFMTFSGTEIGFNVEGGTKISAGFLKVYQELIEINLASDFTGYEKENLGPEINSKFSENGVMISPDGSEMYVVRNGHPGNMGQMKKDDIWRSSLDENGSWKRLQRLGIPLNNRGSNFVISVAPDGNTLLLANTYKEDGTSAGPGLSIAHKSKDGWKVPVTVDVRDFQNQSRYVDFCLSPDGQVLVMAIDNGSTIGGMDLFAAFKEGDEWGEPISLGNEINTFANEFTPFVSADSRTLYFSSFGHPGYGSADLFVSRRLDDSWTFWSEPENLGPDINTKNWDANLSISARGDYAYLTSNENSIGDIDIFRIQLHESLRPKPVILVKGRVINNMTSEGMEATINYYDLMDDVFLGEATSSPGDGSYRIVLPADQSYSFLAEKEGFYSISENIDAFGVDQYTEIEKDLYLGPIQKGSTIRLNNVFFETARYNLMSESYHELNRLITLMNQYPSMKIELAGHTDNEGQEAYNKELSEMRAKEVYNYLLPYFSTDRLSYHGYGESKPIAGNDAEAGRRQNRRVEFTILAMGED